MAINFRTDPGIPPQVLLQLPFNAQVSLPYTVVLWVNCEGNSPSGSQIWGINNNIWGNSGNGYFLEAVGAGAGLFRLRVAIRRTFFGPDFHTATSASTFSDNTWLPVVVLINGSGITPTTMLLYVDGALEATLTMDGLPRPFDTFPYIHVGGYWATGTGSTGDTAFHGCLAYNAMYDVILGAQGIADFTSGTPPSSIQPDDRIYDIQMLDDATAGANQTGPDFERSEGTTPYIITTCPNEPDVTPPVPPPTPGTSGTALYYIERMDNRIWPTIEDAWCLDSALEYPMPTPSASLTISSATGERNITEYTVINGGSGYTTPIGQVIDVAGPGTGALVALTTSSGVISVATPISFGEGYLHPQLSILDAVGTGAVIQPIVTNYVTLSTNTTSFTASDVGSIVRAGGGRMEIVTVSTVTTAIANMIVPVTSVYANDPYNTPLPVAAGDWTMTQPTMTVSGLWHLEGLTVAALADGGVVNGLVVEDGSVTLPVEATQILVGLPFVAQLQTMYMDAGAGPTVQTRRKELTQAVLRVEASRAPEIGANQPDAATQPNQAEIPWGGVPYTAMTQIKDRTPAMFAGQAIPLFSGDLDITNVFTTWDAKAQIAVQQRDPLPLTVTAIVPWVKVGDTPGQ